MPVHRGTPVPLQSILNDRLLIYWRSKLCFPSGRATFLIGNNHTHSCSSLPLTFFLSFETFYLAALELRDQVLEVHLRSHGL